MISQKHFATLLGLLAILIWSTTIAFSRTLAEDLGVITSAAWIFSISGLIGVIVFLWRYRGLGPLKESSRQAVLVCGVLFVCYELALFVAVGTSRSREQVLEVGLINYLWVGLTLVFSVPILHKKARVTLVPGILIAFAGIVLATLQSSTFSVTTTSARFWDAPLPYGLALFCGVAWALYSNLTRRWANVILVSAVPFYLLASGVVLQLIRFFLNEESCWRQGTMLEFGYVALFPILLGYVFWDQAMRKGNVLLTASLSYFIPLISTLISSFVLGVPMGATLWLACALVVGGAVLCRFSVVD